jgi:hypothetical protein
MGHIDVWADPATGLPLRVEVTGRSAARPFLVSRFLDVNLRAPAAGTLVPPAPGPGIDVVDTDPGNVVDALHTLDTGPLPDSLAGQPRVDTDLAGIAAYGSGLARFLVVPVPFFTGHDAMRRMIRGGGARVSFPTGDGVLIATPLLSVLASDDHPARRTFLLAGLVDPKLLKQAGAELSGYLG